MPMQTIKIKLDEDQLVAICTTILNAGKRACEDNDVAWEVDYIKDAREIIKESKSG